jgi:hypothetical protein
MELMLMVMMANVSYEDGVFVLDRLNHGSYISLLGYICDTRTESSTKPIANTHAITQWRVWP